MLFDSDECLQKTDFWDPIRDGWPAWLPCKRGGTFHGKRFPVQYLVEHRILRCSESGPWCWSREVVQQCTIARHETQRGEAWFGLSNLGADRWNRRVNSVREFEEQSLLKLFVNLLCEVGKHDQIRPKREIRCIVIFAIFRKFGWHYFSPKEWPQSRSFPDECVETTAASTTEPLKILAYVFCHTTESYQDHQDIFLRQIESLS